MNTPEEGYRTNPHYREIAGMLERARIPFRVEQFVSHFFIVATLHGQEFRRPLHIGSQVRRSLVRRSVASYRQLVRVKDDPVAFAALCDSKAVVNQPKARTVDVAAETEDVMFRLGQLVKFGEEPRVRDLDVADRLGFERPRDIRKLIDRHEDELKAYGEVCATVAQTSSAGGRPGTEYWLNEPQALIICVFSETKRAAAVRKALIDVFMQWRQGGLAPRLPGHIDPAVQSAVERTFGICRMLAAKITAMEERLAHAPAAPAFDLSASMTALQIAEMAGVKTGERASGLTGAVTKRLKDWCAPRGVAHFRTPSEINASQPWRFPREAALSWLHDQAGADWIRAENSQRRMRAGKVGTQGHLRLAGRAA